MIKTTDDTGIAMALIERLETQRLPRLLDLLKKVNMGTPLNELDLDYMKLSITDATKMKSLIDKHPEYHSLAIKVISLYNEILVQAINVEKNTHNT